MAAGGDAAAAAAAAAALAAAGNNAAPVYKEATGGQVQTIPEFHGREGLETLEWVRFITSAARQYKWSPETTAAVAKSRFRTYAARWYRAQLGNDDEDNICLQWDGPQGLKKAILKRFHPPITLQMAAEAISELKQRGDESVNQFHDRCSVAVGQLFDKNELFTPQFTRGCVEFLSIKKHVISVLFTAGIPNEVRRGIFGVKDPPTTDEEILEACLRIEMEGKSLTDVAVDAISETEGRKSSSKQVEAINFMGRCYGCGQEGHMRKDCRRTSSQPWSRARRAPDRYGRSAGEQPGRGTKERRSERRGRYKKRRERYVNEVSNRDSDNGDGDYSADESDGASGNE